MSVIEEQAKRFASDTEAHQMRIIHDDGLYRHLRCQQEGSWIHGFDVVTWPGYLAYTGDVGCYVFARVADMFDFFDGPPNPTYWSEKLTAPEPSGVLRWSPERFRSHVLDWANEEAEHMPTEKATSFRRQVNGRLLSHEHDETEAIAAIHSWPGSPYPNPIDWSLREFDSRFLWCCHAIPWAISRYREART